MYSRSYLSIYVTALNSMSRYPAPMPYRPNTLFSIVRNTKYAIALKVKASSKPTSPPYAGSPIFLPIGPLSQTCAMPITAPKIPNAKAEMAAMPGGRSEGLAYVDRL